MSSTLSEKVLAIARGQGAVRPGDLDRYRIPRKYLNLLYHKGLLVRSARGVYMSPEADVTEHHTIVEASRRIPKGVICLVSALAFHGLTTQLPHEIWMAVRAGARKPSEKLLPLRVLRFSRESFISGVEKHQMEGVTVRVYCAAKTVADCFKFRNKVGQDVAVEALREYLRKKKMSADELWQYAKICRVWEVMQPYIEAMI